MNGYSWDILVPLYSAIQDGMIPLHGCNVPHYKTYNYIHVEQTFGKISIHSELLMLYAYTALVPKPNFSHVVRTYNILLIW